MDFNLLQLFTLDEILERLGSQRRTGSLHVFTARESATIFFKDGLIVATAKGVLEGEEVITHALDWKDGRYAWQAGVVVPSPPFKALQIHVHEFLARHKATQTEKASDKVMRNPPGKAAVAVKASAPVKEEAPPILIPIRGATTIPLEKAIPAEKAAEKPLFSFAPKPASPAPAPAPVKLTDNTPVAAVSAIANQARLTATKSITQGGREKSAQEEALLAKHRLVLVAADNPALRMKLTRVSGLVGRNPACDITIDHPSISRQHCLLQISDRGLHVKDLGTTNGTKVNGIGMTEGYVSIGDKLTMGHLTFLLEKDS